MAPAVHAQTFHERFNIGVTPPPGCHVEEFPGGAGTYPFPASWALFNVDGRTPNAEVAYVNDAWEVREDFANDISQCAAFSTSWYEPVGQADDWMWTPAIALPAAGVLQWRAIAYDPAFRDGYEVRIKTGAAPTPANQATSTVVYSNPGEEAAWTQRSLDLSAYSGQTIYVGFRNNSNDKFLLVVDDVRIMAAVADLAATAATTFSSEYARAPDDFEITPTLAVTAVNQGAVPLTNVFATATIKLGGVATGAPLVSATIPSLAVGADAPLVFAPAPAFSGAGVWSVEYGLVADQTPSEPDQANNILQSDGTTIGGNELARFEGAATGTLGIGEGTGGELGVAFTLPADATFAGVHFAMGAIAPENGDGEPKPCPGFDYVINLRAFDTANNEPGEIIDTTVPVPCTYEGGSYDVAFVGGAHLLTAGKYVLTAVEPVNGPTLPLPLYLQRFVTGTTWVNWPESPFGGWAHLEEFGTAFMRTPELSLLVGETPIFANGFENPDAPVMPVRRGPAPTVIKDRPTREPAPTQIATLRQGPRTP